MELTHRALVLLVVAGIAAAVPAYVAITRFATAPVASAPVAAAADRCFTAGAVT